MKYLCLLCAEDVLEDMPETEGKEHLEEYLEFTDGLRRSGHFIACNRLQPPREATTIRVRNGKVSATDGPFAETREQLAGFYLVDASDLDTAIGIAERIPVAKRGTVEIRPVLEIPGLPSA